MVLVREVECEWSSVLSPSSSSSSSLISSAEIVGAGWKGKGKAKGRRGRKGRMKGKGMDFELCFVLMALAVTYRLLARETLRLASAASEEEKDEEGREKRGKKMNEGMKYLLQAESVHGYLAKLCSSTSSSSSSSDGGGGGGRGEGVPETNASIQEGLQELAMAEATLLAVAKDDPYALAVAKERDRSDKEWMYKAPSIPKVRASLFGRLCLAAGEHAGRAEVMLMEEVGTGGSVVVGRYAGEVRRAARGKACRCFGVDEELGGEVGRGIAWLRGGRWELGGGKGKEEGGKGWGRLKKGFEERKGEKGREKEREGDGGRGEEGRVVEMLEGKWEKVNDTVSCSFVSIYFASYCFLWGFFWLMCMVRMLDQYADHTTLRAPSRWYAVRTRDPHLQTVCPTRARCRHLGQDARAP